MRPAVATLVACLFEPAIHRLRIAAHWLGWHGASICADKHGWICLFCGAHDGEPPL